MGTGMHPHFTSYVPHPMAVEIRRVYRVDHVSTAQVTAHLVRAAGHWVVREWRIPVSYNGSLLSRALSLE